MALGHQPISTAPLGAIAAVGSVPGVIQPAHHSSGASPFTPAVRIAVPASSYANATSYGAPKIRLTVAPIVLGSGNAFYGPVVSTGVAIQPGSFTNGSNFHGAIIAATRKPAAYANSQSFFAASLSLRVATASFANAQAYHAPRLTLRLFAAIHANANVLYAPTAFQPGILRAPFVASGGALFSPSVLVPNTFQVTGVLNVAGWTPRAPARRPRVATWPNLPNVEAPPWRLVVVTPEIARERARALLMARKRLQGKRRKHELDRRLEASFDDIVDDAVARTVVHLLREDV